jgi:hypothetical protein
MSRTRRVSWRQWIAAIAGFLVVLKSSLFVGRRIFRIASSEVQARGSDEAFLLRLATRRRSG